MTDFVPLLLADRGQDARPIHLVDKTTFGEWAKARPAEDRALLEAHRFDGKQGFAFVILPRGGDFEVVSAVKNAAELSPWCLAKLGESLPDGTYKLASGEPGPAALGWLLAQHRFDRLSVEEGRAGARRPGPADRGSGEDRSRRCGWRTRPRWSATWSTRRRAILGPPSSSKPPAHEAKRSGAHVRVVVRRRA